MEGLRQYQQDFDDHLPLLAVADAPGVANSSGTILHVYGWADALQLYLRNANVYQCPVESRSREYSKPLAPTERGYTDYWFNANLASQKFALIYPSSPLYANLIVVGDGNDGGDLTDARYSLPALPAAWIADKKSPLYRHLESANYAFLDGHVKMLKPEQIGNGPVGQEQYTFSPK